MRMHQTHAHLRTTCIKLLITGFVMNCLCLKVFCVSPDTHVCGLLCMKDIKRSFTLGSDILPYQTAASHARVFSHIVRLCSLQLQRSTTALLCFYTTFPLINTTIIFETLKHADFRKKIVG